MKWEQSSTDNNSDFILLWRHSTQTMTRMWELQFGGPVVVHLTTTKEELCLFSHLGASRPVGTRNCIMCNTWLLHIGNDCSTFPVLMRADTWAQELASYRMPADQQAESNNSARCLLYLIPCTFCPTNLPCVVPNTMAIILHMALFPSVFKCSPSVLKSVTSNDYFHISLHILWACQRW